MKAGNGRILVVDDERINRVLLSTNLEEAGYFVEEAEDGQQALEMLRTRPRVWRLVLMNFSINQ